MTTVDTTLVQDINAPVILELMTEDSLCPTVLGIFKNTDAALEVVYSHIPSSKKSEYMLVSV